MLSTSYAATISKQSQGLNKAQKSRPDGQSAVQCQGVNLSETT